MPGALHSVTTKQTAQTAKAKVNQVKNNAGGFVFEQNAQQKLESFLILGTDNGSYYVGEQDLTQLNFGWLEAMLTQDAVAVINTVVAISNAGRAVSNDPALFVLALAMQQPINKTMVQDALLKVARTFTHLATYAQFLENLGGWGRAKRTSIARWYAEKSPAKLAYQAVKYRQRNGWTHRDLLRLSHANNVHAGVAKFILGKEFDASEVPSIIIGFEHAQRATNIGQLIALVQEYDLPWEAVPTQFHKDIQLWRALFEADLLGQTALVRNVTRIAKLGGFNDLVFAKQYADRLADQQRIIDGRMHPFNYINAAIVYEEGQVDRRKPSMYDIVRNKSWDVNNRVLEGLHAGFDNSFKTVEPANKRTLVAVDVSGSMTWKAPIGTEMSCLQAAIFMAMFIARTEPYSEIRAFSTSLVALNINTRDSFGSSYRKANKIGYGGTDLAQPMLWATKEKREFDTFVTITDNETWYGNMHPFQALKHYRNKSGINAKNAVLGVVSNGFSIADPSDPGMKDFVGFDSNAPRILADFSAGRI